MEKLLILEKKVNGIDTIELELNKIVLKNNNRMELSCKLTGGNELEQKSLKVNKVYDMEESSLFYCL